MAGEADIYIVALGAEKKGYCCSGKRTKGCKFTGEGNMIINTLGNRHAEYATENTPPKIQLDGESCFLLNL
jgi:hypothetical protein